MTFDTLLQRLEKRFASQVALEDWLIFLRRVEQHAPRLRSLLFSVYGQLADFDAQFENILCAAASAFVERPRELKQLDLEREARPRWFQSNQMLAGVCYVDLFAGNLEGIREKIPYFKELGLTYLHLMPLFKCPDGNSDGGYAVSSYREVNPALGTMTQLKDLATELRHNNISLCVDFIFNHTSDEHEWAVKARDGEAHYRDFYFFFDRATADEYDKHLREIFPDQHPGAFSPLSRWIKEDRDQWVWTTFNSFQWDLNYANPAVFAAMGAEMLFLANIGVDVLRMDAVAFIWKQLGTASENLPQAHTLIQAFNALCRIAAPSLIFKSEAIVHPDDVNKYMSSNECQISYNPLLMALLWNSLATRKTRLLSYSMQHRFKIDDNCAWVNYVRVHDDIGWTFSDEDAAWLHINGFDHRRFLNNFYTNRFDGSFARGLPFQENPKTGDCRISGTCASLAGLEQALESEQDKKTSSSSPALIQSSPTVLLDHAIKRILLVHSVIISIGGVPLIYLGDEVGTLNDYGYVKDETKKDDSRWVHRPKTDWKRVEKRNAAATIEGRIYNGLKHLIDIRKHNEIFSNGETEVIDTGSPHVFGYLRKRNGQRLLALTNFSEHHQQTVVRLDKPAKDLVTDTTNFSGSAIVLEPYQFLWLVL
jgi:glycosidase